MHGSQRCERSTNGGYKVGISVYCSKLNIDSRLVEKPSQLAQTFLFPCSKPLLPTFSCYLCFFIPSCLVNLAGIFASKISSVLANNQLFLATTQIFLGSSSIWLAAITICEPLIHLTSLSWIHPTNLPNCPPIHLQITQRPTYHRRT